MEIVSNLLYGDIQVKWIIEEEKSRTLKVLVVNCLENLVKLNFMQTLVFLSLKTSDFERILGFKTVPLVPV